MGRGTSVPRPLFLTSDPRRIFRSLKDFADTLPDYAKDIWLNLGSVLSDQTLGDQRKYGLLLSCAHAAGDKPIVEAAEAEAEGRLDDQRVGRDWRAIGSRAGTFAKAFGMITSRSPVIGT